MGNLGGALAVIQSREVLAELTSEWSDVTIIQRTIRNDQSGDEALLAALQEGVINIGIQRIDQIPTALPDGIVLAAVTRRLEPRSALVARGTKHLDDLAENATIGVMTDRDGSVLNSGHKRFQITRLSGNLEENLGLLASREITALIVPASTLLALDLRPHIDALLDHETFCPPPGQGAVGLLVREDDDLAIDIAYSLQHRPSFERISAERSFASSVAAPYQVGALATLTDDGGLKLFATITDPTTTLKASLIGKIDRAGQLGKELAEDMLEQLAAAN